MEQAAQLIFLSFSGIGTPFWGGTPSPLPGPGEAAIMGCQLPSQLTDTLQGEWSLTIVHFSLVTGIGPRGGGLINSLKIIFQHFGKGVKRVAPSIFLKAKS